VAYLRLISEEEADGLLKEEYDAALERPARSSTSSRR